MAEMYRVHCCKIWKMPGGIHKTHCHYNRSKLNQCGRLVKNKFQGNLKCKAEIITFGNSLVLKMLVYMCQLTHWGWVTHICVSNLTIIVSDNGLSPGRRQAIIWTNAGILVIRPSGTNFSEMLIEIDVFSFKKMHLKVSSAKRRPFCLGLIVLSKSSLVHAMALCLHCAKPLSQLNFTNYQLDLCERLLS